jgi:MSHA biogenesis protein MshJ
MKAQTPIDLALLRRRFAPLLSAWQRQAQRIDALSLRERAILFVSIAAVLALLFDSLVLTPLSARQKMRADVQAKQAAEVTQLREQFVAASRNNDAPGGRLRVQLEAARAERARLDDALREAGSAGLGDGLAVVLQKLLSQQPGLVLEKLTLLDEADPIAPRTPLPVLPGIAWQGVELQVQGRWPDVQRYLQALERELPGLRWGELRLNAGTGDEPPRVQVQVFMLKVQP